jgi:MerR family redox-sensitive transcriptional activator SoxR
VSATPLLARTPDELTIGELSAVTGVPVTTLRFYDRRGLISARRTTGNQRRYPRTVPRRLALIRIAQRLGAPLAEIASALPDDRDPTPHEWRAMLVRWHADLDRRIARLQEVRDYAARLASCGRVPVHHYGQAAHDLVSGCLSGRHWCGRTCNASAEPESFGA